MAGGAIVLFGGETSTGLPTSDAWYVQGTDDAWRTVPRSDANVRGAGGAPRAYHCAVTTDLGAMIVFGGMLEDGTSSNETWVLDTVSSSE
jgi:hypothetical protein